MEYINTINRIIEAEQRAQSIAAEAVEKEVHLEDELKKEIETIHAAYQDRVKRRMQLVNAQENQLVDERIKEFDEQNAKTVAKAKETYAKNREAWIDRLFEMLIES